MMMKIAIHVLAALMAVASASAVDSAADKLAARRIRAKSGKGGGPGTKSGKAGKGNGPKPQPPTPSVCRELPSGEVSFALEPRCENFNCNPSGDGLPVPWFDWTVLYDDEEYVGVQNWIGSGAAYINCNDFNGLGVFDPAPTGRGGAEKYFMCTVEIRFIAEGFIDQEEASIFDAEQVSIVATGTAFSFYDTGLGDGDLVFEANLTIIGADEKNSGGTRPSQVNSQAECAVSQIPSASGNINLEQFNDGTASMTINFK